MFPSNPHNVLYPDSPFIPKIEFYSLLKIIQSVNEFDLHPVAAIAHEVRLTGSLHSQFLNNHTEWILEKFNINEEGLDNFFFGLIIPSTFLVALDMIEDQTLDKTMNFLFPPTGDKVIDSVKNYVDKNIDNVYELLDLNQDDPFEAAKKLFDFCRLVVYSDDYWYLVGLEVGIAMFKNFTELFLFEEIVDEPEDLI